MQFIDFQKSLSIYPVFSLQDIFKIVPKFHRVQLDRWRKKGYIQLIKREFYRFTTEHTNLDFLFYTANKIYAPSYISLDMALKYYGFIPEEVFQVTSVSTKKTTSFETAIGNFSYRHIKPELFWGYRLVEFRQQKLLLAEPEKAVLDYLYLHATLRTVADFEGMRINIDEFKEKINLEKFQNYLLMFENKSLTRRAHTFLRSISDDFT